MKRSSKSKRYVSIMGLILAASVALFMFAGCSSNAVNNDDQNPIDPKINFFYETGEADQNYAAPPLLDIVKTKVDKVVGIAGGSIEVALDNGKAQFTVPPGALLKPINITLDVTEYSTPRGSIFIYDCGPDGTQFKVPAKLSQPMPVGQGFAFIYYFNEVSGEWELQEVVKVKDGIATFSIKHFSKYGIS